MKHQMKKTKKFGRFGLDILLWIFGIPLPFIILFSLMRGCQ